MKNYKPAGYNSISPYFMLEDAPKWCQFVKNLLEAEELRRYENPDGSIMHVELKIDDSVIMLSQATQVYPANPFMLHVYVPDAAAIFKKALQLGCEPMQEPVIAEGDTDLRGMFKDFAGNIWAVGTKVT